MKSFYQFWDQINGKVDLPPQKYRFQNYMDMSNSPLNGSEEGTAKLSPLSDDDMKRYAASDVVDWYSKYGKNLNKLGQELSDEEYRKFQGIE